MIALAKRFMLRAAMLWLVIGQFGSAQADPMAYVVAHDYSGSGGPDLFGQVDLTNGNFNLVSNLSATQPYTIFGMGFGSGGQIYGLGYNFPTPPRTANSSASIRRREPQPTSVPSASFRSQEPAIRVGLSMRLTSTVNSTQ